MKAATKTPSNTERLINSLRLANQLGLKHVDFMVGKYTGNGPSVIAALRRRGFKVSKNSPGKSSSYRLEQQC